MMGMDFSQGVTLLTIPIQILFIDLLLSADNALMIALACRALPPADMRTAVLFGTAGAIALRIAMAAVVLFVLQVPGLKLVAGAILLGIAVKLTLGRDGTVPETTRARTDMIGAVVAIIAADAVMSLDNVVAVAAVAQGSLLLLSFGLLMSIPMLVYGSALIRGLLDGRNLLVLLADMFLGWIAGSIAISDPLVAGWIAASAPALVIAVPLACAIFVLWEGRILSGSRMQRVPVPQLPLQEGELDAG